MSSKTTYQLAVHLTYQASPLQGRRVRRAINECGGLTHPTRASAMKAAGKMSVMAEVEWINVSKVTVTHLTKVYRAWKEPAEAA